jgi:hypothetical protein
MITQDPRPDIELDHRLWADVLALCNHYNRELKIMMAALRVTECCLWLSEGKLCFSFNRENLDERMITKAKETLQPHQIILKSIFERVAKKHRDPKDWQEEIPF